MIKIAEPPMSNDKTKYLNKLIKLNEMEQFSIQITINDPWMSLKNYIYQRGRVSRASNTEPQKDLWGAGEFKFPVK